MNVVPLSWQLHVVSVIALIFRVALVAQPPPSDTSAQGVGLCKGKRPSFRAQFAEGWGEITHHDR